MSEPRYLFGDDYAYQSYEDNERWVNCEICKQEFDRFKYISDICLECDENKAREKEKVNG